MAGLNLDYKTSVLKNGIRVISAELKNTAAVTSLILVGTGSHYEKKGLAGVSHFLEHLVFKGSKKYPSAIKISTILDGLGAQYNAFTDDEMTGFYIKTIRDKTDIALDVMSDFLKNPLFKTEEIERERGVILEELRMYYDMPQRHVVDLFREVLYGNQQAGVSVGGTEGTVANITPKDIKDYFKKQYAGGNIVAVFAGNISHEEARGLAKKYIEDISEGSPYKKPPVKDLESKTGKVLVQDKKTDQTHIAIGSKTFSLSDKRRYALDILATILGGGMSSRLFHEVRERRGLAYYVSAGADLGTDFGYFLARAGVTNDKAKDAVKVILDEFKKIADNLPRREEMEKAKNHIEGSTLLEIETSNSVASELGVSELLLKRIITPTEYIEKIKKVTPKDVVSVANDIFKTENIRIALIGPQKNAEEFENLI
ncbi:MAG: pitrilysin family protein [Candidatus Spechtbacteria bacterium]|nr:pitrilysin family protein [Candidatus Spechtbacteria bacterium]